MRPLDFLGRIKVKLGMVILLAVVAAFVVNEVGINAGYSRNVRVAVAAVLALIMVQLLARGMTKPLREMAAAAQTIAKGRYGLRVSATSRDEVGELARAFNAMAADLGEVDRQRRELVANVSHELRTPITALRAVLENVVDGVSTPDPATLGTALAQTERLGRLVAQLLDLSRLDSGARRIELEEVELRPLCEQALREAVLARDGVTARCEVPEGLSARADPDLLAQVLANLLDNAVRHSPDGGVVVLAAACEGAGVRLRVTDSGPGIPPDDRARAFERFSRLDAGRATDEGGAGLGLAIVKEIVELHGGSIHVENGVGCRIAVDLPERSAMGTPSDPTPTPIPAPVSAPTSAPIPVSDSTPTPIPIPVPDPIPAPIPVPAPTPVAASAPASASTPDPASPASDAGEIPSASSEIPPVPPVLSVSPHSLAPAPPPPEAPPPSIHEPVLDAAPSRRAPGRNWAGAFAGLALGGFLGLFGGLALGMIFGILDPVLGALVGAGVMVAGGFIGTVVGTSPFPSANQAAPPGPEGARPAQGASGWGSGPPRRETVQSEGARGGSAGGYVAPPVFPRPNLPPTPRWMLPACAAVGLLAALALPYSDVGLGFVLVAVALGAAVLPAARRRITPWSAGLAVLAYALVAMAMFRDAGWLVGPLLLAGFLLAALALSGAGRGWLGMARGGASVLAGVLPVPWFLAAPVRDMSLRRKVVPVLLGGCLALVLVLLFGSLFASADPVFAKLVEQVFLAQDWAQSMPLRILLFAGFAVVAASAVLVALRPVAQVPTPALRLTVSRGLWVIPLIALNLLFAVFVAMQVTVLFGSTRWVVSAAGLTYAEYARSGFFQLVVVSVFVLAIVAVASWVIELRGRERWLMAGSLGLLCALTMIVLASALHRLDLYVDAYGFSRLRATVEAVIWWLGAVFALVLAAGAVRLTRHGRAGWLPRALVMTTGVALLAFAVWNPDLRVAETQVTIRGADRLDQEYLRDLGAEAVPALDRLPEPTRSCVLRNLVVVNRLLTPDPWNGWNLARQQAREVLERRPYRTEVSCPPDSLSRLDIPSQN
ncbi:DUF4153 domain-containing protein [Streptosporangium sp. NPDC006007]|uniref:DUF4153 domain-containing protein n=1 Tax=Streptosporangium sp. NPDC006007 TaxID=3154575 RepID=UPI0033BB0878